MRGVIPCPAPGCRRVFQAADLTRRVTCSTTCLERLRAAGRVPKHQPIGRGKA